MAATCFLFYGSKAKAMVLMVLCRFVCFLHNLPKVTFSAIKMCSTGGWKTLFLDPHVPSSIQSSMQATSPTTVKGEIPHQGYFHRDCQTDKPSNVKTKNEVRVNWPFQCHLCPESFSLKETLNKHLCTHTASMQVTSPTTVKVEIPHQGYFHRDCQTDKPSNVKTKNEVHVSWPFECHLCPESFSLKETLNKHLCTHTDTRTFRCSSCPRSFWRRVDMIRHLRTHTGERPFQCPSCPRSFSQRVHLKTHLRIHTGERPFQCPSCPWSFRQTGDLKTHLRTHTGEKPHQCSLCPQSFLQGDHLKTHLRTHTGERPFQCPACPQSFRQRGHLKTHQGIHTGERPHQCSLCHRRFLQRDHLKTHLRTHTGERPFQCPSCPQSFRQRSHLKAHLRIHTDERPL
ncbi:zinc finger protein 774-like isoform X1 [Dermacentor albipictus]|uniref:zinc finger protein 774-like isoform X1 n=2 Tax=Dermacentor albipictus TaxID=60249 RepID=UPI0038FCE7D4